MQDVMFDLKKDSRAINYVKARMEIDNSNEGHKRRRLFKHEVISFLGGVVEPSGKHAIVKFPDNTKARF